MASNKRTIYLGLDYSDFTGGITEVNRKMGLLDTEFKLAQEQAKNYGNETDRLGLKHEYLTQKIALQNQKLDDAKKAYDKALLSGNATEKQIDALDKKLLNERLTLEKLVGQLNSHNNEMKSAATETSSFGDSIRGLASDLGININPTIEKLASKFDGVSKSAGEAAIGVAAVITALVGCSVSLAKTSDDLLTLSAKTGLTTEQLQKLQYASELVDVDTTTMTDSIQKLTRSMDNARSGTKEYQEAFKRLRVEYKNSKGELLDANEVFYRTIDALGKVRNTTERNALAMKLFGRSADDLYPLIKAGSKVLKEYGIEAESLGLILSDDVLEAGGALDDSMQKWNSTVQALKNSLGAFLLPVLTNIFELLSSIPTPVLTMISVFGVLAAIAFKVTSAIKQTAVANALLAATNTTVGVTGTAATAGMSGLLPVLLIVAGAIAIIAGTYAAFKSALKDTEDTVANIADSTNTAINGTNKTVSNYQNAKTYSSKNNVSGTDNFPGGYTWINEGKPELVKFPRGTQIVDGESSEKLMGGDNYYIDLSINASSIEEFQDVIRIVKGASFRGRRA